MKKDNIVLIILMSVLVVLFIYNDIARLSIIDSINLWIYSIVPSMLPMYLMTDLLLNYGLLDVIYSVFRTNKAVLFMISMLMGSPANAKYIKEFYEGGYISLDESNYMLTFAYSPNPLFILGMSESTYAAVYTIIFIYLSSFVNIYIFRYICKNKGSGYKRFSKLGFTECLEKSIYRSFKVLVLILGIVVVYGLIMVILSAIFKGNCLFLKSIIELTNALSSIKMVGDYRLFTFACAFGGLSIHTQIKSILEDTDIDYKYFLYGRIIASCISLLFLIF